VATGSGRDSRTEGESMSIEAMKSALEALEMLAKWEHPASKITTKTGHIYPHHVAANAATALRAAIEAKLKEKNR
jgi:hypothetical protein